jgi:3-oxoacyl-[acyl-carrier-protein] synthase II
MFDIAITGLGVVSPIGVGREAFFSSLSTGRTVGQEGVARVGDFGAKNEIALASLRRMPRVVQMTLVAAKQALKQAAWSLEGDTTRIGIVLATGLGTLDETVRFIDGYLEGGPDQASPQLFPQSVMNAAAGQIAMELKIRGVNTTVNHRDASPLQALAVACDLLTLGRADALLVGALDEASAPAVRGYREFVKLSDASRPYDSSPSGMLVGEGATVLMLERVADAKVRGAAILGRITKILQNGEQRPRVGWGAGPWPRAAALFKEICADKRPQWISGQANGTEMDRVELTTLEEALGALPPVSSLVGQVGESFSSPMFRVAAALFALEQQMLPGTPLTQRPANAAVVTAARPAAVETVLVPSCAQGGANVAALIERA